MTSPGKIFLPLSLFLKVFLALLVLKMNLINDINLLDTGIWTRMQKKEHKHMTLHLVWP